MSLVVLTVKNKMKNINPRRVPIVHVDEDFPALPAEVLTADFLRSSFASPPLCWGSVAQETPLILPQHAVKKAAVLLALVETLDKAQGSAASELSVLFMQRSMHLKDHAGQISLPGGKVEQGDKNSVETALRETHEEIGVEPNQVEVWGTMPSYTSVSAFEITPVVGLIKEMKPLVLCTDEVLETFTVPLSFLMNPANQRWHEYHSQTVNGSDVVRRWLSMEYIQGEKSYFIWGVTAAILRNFYLYLRAAQQCDPLGRNRL
ncbi:MAG: NUDIX hydrolase [Saezia sp.]